MQRAVTVLRRLSVPATWNQDYIDAGVGVGLAAAVLANAAVQRAPLDAAAIVLLLGQTLPLALRCRQPHAVLLVAGLSIGLYSGLGYRELGGSVGVLVAFYSVAANTSRRHTLIAAAFCAIGVFITLLNYSGRDPSAMPQLLGVYLEFAVAWLIGDYLRVRRAYTRELEERAARLEREREERAQLAVAAERTRIARDLHDVVAHHVSVMVVQAGAARRIAEMDPPAARDALVAVEAAGRTALTEMRHMLEVLRAEEAGVGPQPSLADLERLVGQVREAGLPVDLAVVGRARPLPAGMDVAAYRVVQEALTNTVRHAGRARATVTVRYGERLLEIEVTDDGRGAAAPLLEGVSGGHGLVGMQERIQLYGGELEVGPRLNGGFRVRACLPLEPEPDPAAPGEARSALSAVASVAVHDRLEGTTSAIVRIAPPEPAGARTVAHRRAGGAS